MDISVSFKGKIRKFGFPSNMQDFRQNTQKSFREAQIDPFDP
jgi:hypothetical protein